MKTRRNTELNLIDKCRGHANFELTTNKEATGLLHATSGPDEIVGVSCADGSTYRASRVVLAAGAMASPRILQDYLEQTGLEKTLRSAPLVGANFKFHINSALLGFSPFTKQDVLRKTAIFFNDAFPHSSVQCLGWIDGEILGTQLPAAVPKFVASAAGARAYGFFVTTEDGSSRDNRVVSCGGHGGLPVMDYDFSRIQPSIDEHRRVVRAFEARLLRAGLVGVAKYMGLAGTAHALGSLVTGNNPGKSVVDAHGKVHGMENLYVADGSVLPRSSRVNPALSIYAWGLRLGQHLASE
jgi:choline dehydrogenase-like flavoprotein